MKQYQKKIILSKKQITIVQEAAQQTNGMHPTLVEGTQCMKFGGLRIKDCFGE